MVRLFSVNPAGQARRERDMPRALSPTRRENLMNWAHRMLAGRSIRVDLVPGPPAPPGLVQEMGLWRSIYQASWSGRGYDQYYWASWRYMERLRAQERDPGDLCDVLGEGFPRDLIFLKSMALTQ